MGGVGWGEELVVPIESRVLEWVIRMEVRGCLGNRRELNWMGFEEGAGRIDRHTNTSQTGPTRAYHTPTRYTRHATYQARRLEEMTTDMGEMS